MHTVLNPLLLAALLAPAHDARHEGALNVIAPRFDEPAPGPGTFDVTPEEDRGLRAYINLEEISTGWAWTDNTADASPENYREHLAARIGVDMFNRGEALIRRAKQWDADYEAARPAMAAWERRRAEHQLLAPRIAFAQALLAQVPGFVQVPDEGMEKWENAMQAWAVSTGQPVVKYDGAALQQALARNDRQPVAVPPPPSLLDIAEYWSNNVVEEAATAARKAAFNVENFLQYARQRAHYDFDLLLQAADVEGIKMTIKLDEMGAREVSAGKTADVQVGVVFTLPPAGAEQQPEVTLYYQPLSELVWRAVDPQHNRESMGEPHHLHAGKWGYMNDAGWRSFEPMQMGQLAATLRTKLLGCAPLPAQINPPA